MLSRTKLRCLRQTHTSAPNKLKLAKKLAKITQTRIAAKVGLPQSQVSLDVNGKSPEMSLAKARAYAGVFGCSVDDLFPPEASA